MSSIFEDFTVLALWPKNDRYSLIKGKVENAHFFHATKQSNYFLTLLLNVVTLLSEYRREI